MKLISKGVDESCSLPAAQLVDPRREFFNVRFVDDQCRNDDLPAGRDTGSVAFRSLRHEFDGLIAELIRLLDDSCIDRPLFHSFQGFRWF